MRMAIGQVLQAAGAAPTPEFEPSGSWIRQEDQFLSYSNDGRNWQRVAFAPTNNNYRAALDVPQYVHPGNDIVLAGVNGSAQSYKMANKSIPNFTTGVNFGLCQWVAKDGGPIWVARTTTLLKTSADGITWSDQTPPANWSSIGSGYFTYLPTAGVYISTGSTFNISFPAGYWTSGNGIGWTQRTFPENWVGNGQANVDWIVDNGSIIVVALQNGNIYTSTDAVNWTLRASFGALCIGLCWCPALGKFYASVFLANPANLKESTDGITWTNVVGNNLDSFLNTSGLCADPIKPLLLAGGGQGNSTNFSKTGQAAYSVDGITWIRRDVRFGRWPQHAPFKIGPAPPEIAVNVASITIFSAQATPTSAFGGLIVRQDCTIDEQTNAGIVQLAFWTSFLAVDTLNSGNVDVRLDWVGDAFNFGTNQPINTWINIAAADRLWRYQTTLGVLSGSGTLRFRYRDTQEEVVSIPVSITVEST